ncbi:MAG: dephospho-CoA kinase [Thermoanaerobaculaceae bacterium]|nr:dephospho-CoA kinase [Thermoanaerobaculaceae bacterium]
MIKVGITGGIGSGKSEAKEIFKKYGAFVVDADEIVRNLLEKNGEGYKQVLNEFGNEILDNGLEIDKNKLSSIVFSDALKRRKLEEILHPLVIKKREEIFAKLQKKLSEKDIVVAEAALIFEANTKKYFDYVILIKAPKDLRIKRLLSKGFSLSEIEKRMKAQWEDEKKEKLADFVIENNSSLEELEKKVANVIEKIRKG